MTAIKTIAIIIPNLGPGGAQQVFRAQIRFLRDVYHVLPVVFNRSGMTDQDQSLNCYFLDVPAGKTAFGKAFNFVLRILKFRLFKKRNKVDLSISHLEGADYVNILSGISRTIIWVHGSKTHDRKIGGTLGWLRKRIMIPWLYGRSDTIVTVSKGLQDELTNDFSLPVEKICVVHNGLRIGDIEALASGALPDRYVPVFRDHFVIVTHCRFAAQKNLESLIAIIGSLKDQIKIRWVILGDGELRNALIDQCAGIGVKIHTVWQSKDPAYDETVYFPGYIEQPYTFLKNASLYIMTSAWEGYPLSLIEALACKLPVMSSDCYTGPAEIIGIREGESAKTYPYYGLCGVLMPVIEGPNDKERVELWRNEILALSSNLRIIAEFRLAAANCARGFSDHMSNEKTLAVVESMSYI